MYKHIPWLVEENISNITKPQNRNNFYVRDKVLVASAEQSFITLLKNQDVGLGYYIGLSPCFRDEDDINNLHNNYFMKSELFITENVNSNNLQNVINHALEFFNQYIKCEVIKINDLSYDIIDSKNKLELGSYGIRMHNNYMWIYGTGCAEPRLTKLINL